MARLLLVLAVTYTTVSLFGYQTGACMKKEEPRPQTTLPPLETTTYPDTITVNCSSNDTFYGKCTNDGYCVVMISTQDASRRTSSCRCDPLHTGAQCENVQRPNLKTGGLVTEGGSMYAAIGVAVLVLLVIVVSIIAILKIKHDRAHGVTTERTDSPGSPNGLASARPTAQFSLYSSPSQNGDGAPHEEEEEIMLQVEESV